MATRPPVQCLSITYPRGTGSPNSPSGTALQRQPSIRIALCYVFQAALLVALLGPIAFPFLLIFGPPLHVFGAHVYLHGLLAMPRAVHLCILPVTLIMGIVGCIIWVVDYFYLPLSLLCLTVGIRLGSCRGIPSSERLEQSPSLREVALSHPRGTSPAVTPEEAQAAAQRYLEHDEVWAALEGDGGKESERPVRLVRLSWLLALGQPGSSVHRKYGGVLPRRQELPEAAFIGVDELRKISLQAKRGVDFYSFFEMMVLEWQLGEGNQFKRVLRVLFQFFSCKFVKRNVDDLLPIVAVSYCWLEPKHPDCEGEQLRLLCTRLKKLFPSLGVLRRSGLLGVCQAYGFRNMGVFFDWASLFQKDPKLWTPAELVPEEGRTEDQRRAVELYRDSRSQAHAQATKFALDHTMDLWYAHSKTTVVLLTELPKKLPDSFDAKRTYESRGWTTFERCSAELGKSFTLQQAGWTLVIDLGKQRAALRRLPTAPERMGTLLQERSFTNGADRAQVLALYKKTARAVLGGVKELSFLGMPLDPKDPWRSPERLGQALNFCVNLKKLDLNFTGLTDEHLASISGVLSSSALPQLEQLFLAFNRLGPRGIEALGSALVSGVASSLKTLILIGNDFGDAGLKSFAAFMAMGMARELQLVDLGGNDFGDAGAFALADAVRLRLASGECKVGTNFLCGFNHVGMRGRLALSAAVKPDFLQFLISFLVNALYPRGVIEGGKRTLRHEAYSFLHAEYRHTQDKRDLSADDQYGAPPGSGLGEMAVVDYA